jgi:hypothetical protein
LAEMYQFPVRAYLRAMWRWLLGRWAAVENTYCSTFVNEPQRRRGRRGKRRTKANCYNLNCFVEYVRWSIAFWINFSITGVIIFRYSMLNIH